METGSVVAIVLALDQHQVRYLIVGGLAVVAHGYVRFTADVDIMLSVEPDNLRRAVTGLKTLGYGPRAPVEFDEFVDPAMRQRWAREKNMTVFSLFSEAHRATEIDLFLEPPINFEAAHERAVRKEVGPGVEATFCGLDDLIALKEQTGRPRDLDDIEHLKRLGVNRHD